MAGYKFIYMLTIGPKPGPIFSSKCLDDDSGDESKERVLPHSHSTIVYLITQQIYVFVKIYSLIGTFHGRI